VAEEAPIYVKGLARKGPTFREAILMHSVARLALFPWFSNIQASWVKLGPDGVAAALNAGANDIGGTLMNESITRAAGAAHGEELAPHRMEAIAQRHRPPGSSAVNALRLSAGDTAAARAPGSARWVRSSIAPPKEYERA
jgi:FO synthase